MNADTDIVTLKVAYNRLCVPGNHNLEKLITIKRETFIEINDKEKLVAFLKSEFELGDSKNIKILRKSKKHKDYISLESKDDFKSLSRSLKVKNHIKLLINDSSPAAHSCQHGCNNNYRRRKTMDFASLGRALVEASFTVLSEFKGNEIPTDPQWRHNNTQLPKHDYVHEHVACDSCHPTSFSPIKGVRYKCLICPDYDLCEGCEAQQHIEGRNDGNHVLTHPMAKITKPLQESQSQFSRTFVNRDSDIIYDIPMTGCSLGNRERIEAILNEGSLDQFFKNVDQVLDESDKYKILLSLIKVNDANEEEKEEEVEENKDTKFAMLQSLIEFAVTQTKVPEDRHGYKTSNVATTTKSNDELMPSSDNEIEEPSSGSKSNKVSIYAKRFAPNSRVISLMLYNQSFYPICGGELKFEFSESLGIAATIKNVRTILPGEKRCFNLDIYSEKFDKLTDRKLKISTPDGSIIMKGTYSPGEFTSLEIVNKPSVLTPTQSKICEEGSVDVALVPKSNNMVQINIINKLDKSLDCSHLKFQVINCFDLVICNLTVRGHNVLPGKTGKYNIGLNNAHLKYPFKLLMSTDEIVGTCNLSLKHLNGTFEVKQKKDLNCNLVDDENISKVDKYENYSSGTESIIEEFQKIGNFDNEELDMSHTSGKTENLSKSLAASVHSVVLPTLPKESLLESKTMSASEYADAKSYIDNNGHATIADGNNSFVRDDGNDYDIISIGEEGEDEFDSDFEVLSPASSH